MRLEDMRDNPGATKPRKRVGRGIGSGTGKTSGRGVKGQKARSGVAIKGFEGGQMPIYRRLPRRGFTPRNKVVYQVINLSALEKAFEAGKLNAGQAVDRDALVAAGMVRVNGAPVRILAKGEIKTSLNVTVHSASAKAKAAIEAAGGTVIVEAKTVEAEG
jgi:large subunit ribosomal protein L15